MSFRKELLETCSRAWIPPFFMRILRYLEIVRALYSTGYSNSRTDRWSALYQIRCVRKMRRMRNEIVKTIFLQTLS